MLFIIVAFTFQAVVSLCHYLVYKTIVETIPLPENGRFWLGVSLTALSLVFFIANLISNKFSNAFIDLVYTAGAFWIGTLLFFLFASVAIAIITLINSSTGFHLNMSWVSGTLFTLALLTSIYATWHSTDVQNVSIEAEIPNLPSSWDGKKIAFFADSHFGNVRNIALAQKISATILKERPELVLIGGDVFDGPKIDSSKTADALAPLAHSIPTYFVTGNHEYYGAKAEFLKSLTEIAGMHLLNDEKVIVNGLSVIGLDYQNTTTAEGVKTSLTKAGVIATEPTILVKHTPFNLQPLEESGVALGLFGHTHCGQMFPFSLLTRRIYHGYDYGLKKFKAMSVYTTSGVGTWGPPQRFGTQAEIVFITLKQKAINHFAFRD